MLAKSQERQQQQQRNNRSGRSTRSSQSASRDKRKRRETATRRRQGAVAGGLLGGQSGRAAAKEDVDQLVQRLLDLRHPTARVEDVLVGKRMLAKQNRQREELMRDLERKFNLAAVSSNSSSSSSSSSAGVPTSLASTSSIRRRSDVLRSLKDALAVEEEEVYIFDRAAAEAGETGKPDTDNGRRATASKTKMAALALTCCGGHQRRAGPLDLSALHWEEE